MSARDDGLTRLTSEETRVLLEADGSPVGTIVDADGRPVDEPLQLPLSAPAPVDPAPVSLPVSSSAWIAEIRSEGAATAAGISVGYTDERAEGQKAHAAALADLALYREQRTVAQERFEELTKTLEEFVAGLPRRVRRRIGQPPSRVTKLTPWAMWVADTLMIANAYGVFGAVALPFPQSAYLSNGVQLLRAGMVSFGLVFGLRFVGGRLRDRTEELRESLQWLGRLIDVSVIGSVIAAGVLLAVSAAKLQEAFLRLAAGGTQVRVPTSVLLAIVIFLGSVSLATGYFSAEPELARVAALEALVEAARKDLDDVWARLARQLGVARGLRGRLRAIVERERLELIEQEQQTERRVYHHLGGNVPIYGLELDTEAARVPGRES